MMRAVRVVRYLPKRVSRVELDISLEVVGLDGFAMRGVSSMREIGRDLLDLVGASALAILLSYLLG